MTDKQWIRERLAALRESMREQNVQYVIIPTGDYHNSEYVSDFFRTREFYTGFTGSNGTLLVTDREARLWTDGRYFVQAEKELAGTDIILMKMSEEGVPTLPRLIAGQYREGERIGVDERIIPIHTVELLMHALEEKLHTKMEAGNVLVMDENGTVKAVKDPSVNYQNYLVPEAGVFSSTVPLCYLNLNQIYVLDVFFYLEGCDPDCTDYIENIDFDFQIGLYGILTEEVP